MREIKNGSSIHLAPDGPRGPLRKINSEIVNIAKKTDTPIFPVAIKYSLKKQCQYTIYDIIIQFCKNVTIGAT